jgi:hypothetical protein
MSNISASDKGDDTALHHITIVYNNVFEAPTLT